MANSPFTALRDADVAQLRIRVHRIAAQVNGTQRDWSAAAALSELRIPPEVLTIVKASKTAANVLIQAGAAVTKSGIAAVFSRESLVGLAYECLNKDPQTAAKLVGDTESARGIPAGKLLDGLRRFERSMRLPPLVADEAQVAELESFSPIPVPPLVVPTPGATESALSVIPPPAPRGDSIDYSQCPSKDECRRQEASFALNHSTVAERPTMRTLFLGSRRPQLQGRVILDTLKVTPDQVWVSEISEEAIPHCRSGAEEIGAHFVPGDVNEFLPTFLKMPGVKYISLDWHQPWCDVIEASLGHMHESKDPLILGMWQQARREGAEARDKQMTAHALRQAQLSAAEAAYETGAPPTLKDATRRMATINREASGGINLQQRPAGEASRELLERGETHKDARRESLAALVIMGVMNGNPTSLSESSIAAMFKIGSLAANAFKPLAGKVTNGNQLLATIPQVFGGAMNIARAPLWPSAIDRWSYVSKTGTPMAVTFVRFDPADACVGRVSGVGRALRGLFDNISTHGMDEVSCRVEKSTLRSLFVPRTFPAENLILIFYRGRERIGSVGLGAFLQYVKLSSPYQERMFNHPPEKKIKLKADQRS